MKDEAVIIRRLRERPSPSAKSRSQRG